jgi:hypothetical protein
MSAEERSTWTEKQEKVIEAMRRDMQHTKQKHEAALEEQKRGLLQSQHETVFT